MSNEQRILSKWFDRWSAIDDHLSNLITCLNKGVDFDRKETFKNLIAQLQAFGRSHFNYFYDGFSGEASYTLCQSEKFPAELALASILRQVSHDLQLIELAIAQRKTEEACDTHNYVETLKKCDRLAMEALMPAVNKLIGDDIRVVTYFQKSTSVRLIPYAPVALIGLPFSCTKVDQDLLAIPHEVAHYIYRHGKINVDDEEWYINRRISNDLPQTPHWIRNWAEELFADTYGCIIGGPVMGLDFQDLQLRYSKKGFVSDAHDKEDPPPILRPVSYHKVVVSKSQFIPDQKLSEQWARIGGLLRNNWEARLNELFSEGLETAANLELTFKTVNDTVRVKDTASDGTQIRPMKEKLPRTAQPEIAEKNNSKAFDFYPIDFVLDLYLRTFADIIEKHHSTWSGDVGALQKIEDERQLSKLYDNFSAYLATTEEERNQQIIEDYEDEPERRVSIAGFPDHVTVVWRDWTEKRVLNTNTVDTLFKGEISEDVWEGLLIADGWITRGPKDNPIGE